jgi:hypothetical protein
VSAAETIEFKPGRLCCKCHRVLREGQEITEFHQFEGSSLLGMVHDSCCSPRSELVTRRGIAKRVPR